MKRIRRQCRMRKGIEAKWENFSLAQGVGFRCGDSGEWNGLGRIDAKLRRITAGRRAKRGFKLSEFVS